MTVDLKHKHDLEYIAELMDSLTKTREVLSYIYHEKVSRCPHRSYDDEAFETFCNHLQILREINEDTDCRHCPHFTESDEKQKLRMVKT